MKITYKILLLSLILSLFAGASFARTLEVFVRDGEGKVYVTVVDPFTTLAPAPSVSEALSEATVRIETSSGGVLAEGRTNAQGEVSFGGIESRGLKVNVSKIGFRFQEFDLPDSGLRIDALVYLKRISFRDRIRLVPVSKIFPRTR